MSFRTRRLRLGTVAVEPFAWSPTQPVATADHGAGHGRLGLGRRGRPADAGRAATLGSAPAPAPAETFQPTPDQQAQLAALERDAFTKGYAQGERAGLEAGGTRADAMLRRLAQTLDELSALRDNMVRQTERELVQLSVAIARRILQREVSSTPSYRRMARVALDRLGDTGPATIRLHPDDYAIVTSGQARHSGGRTVDIVADPRVARGGCLVESEFGSIDASVDAQVDETRARRAR